jgi:hypothetical protein
MRVSSWAAVSDRTAPSSSGHSCSMCSRRSQAGASSAACCDTPQEAEQLLRCRLQGPVGLGRARVLPDLAQRIVGSQGHLSGHAITRQQQHGSRLLGHPGIAQDRHLQRHRLVSVRVPVRCLGNSQPLSGLLGCSVCLGGLLIDVLANNALADFDAPCGGEVDDHA